MPLRKRPQLAHSARISAGLLAGQGQWCGCKRVRGDIVHGVHVKCGRQTQGGPNGPTPIDVRAALRNNSRTGVGTVGDGIGEPGDPSPTLSTSGATPAVYVKAARASHAWYVDKGTVESWKPGELAPTLNVNDNTGDTRATAVVLEQALAVDGRSGATSDKTNTLTHDMDTARVANRRVGTVMALTTNSVQHYDENSAQAGHLLVDPAPLADCGCCPADPKPDSARYRACGNAVTVPVIEWIGHRLLSADAP